MALPIFILAVILGILLAETRLSRRHEAWLRTRGAEAPPGDVYVAMAVAYPAAFVAMGVEGALRSASVDGVFVSGVLLFAASKGLKYWAIGALGDRWTFRVLVEPALPLVRSGPYRYVAHPNYVAVVGELAGTALMMHAAVTGPIALAVFGALLWARIRFETETLRRAYDEKTDSP